MKVVITGSVGTGKTSVAELLAGRFQWPLVRLSDALADLPSRRNRKLDTREVAATDLDRWAIRKTGNFTDWIIEGHMACELGMPADYVFVLRTHPDELEGRLAQRKYLKAKVRENVMAEALDYCLLKVSGKRNVFEIDTTGKTAMQSADEIARMLEGRKRTARKISWSSWLHAAIRIQEKRKGGKAKKAAKEKKR
jgi:adenylate kinase